MGLTSGQARLLMLTSRLNDIQLDMILLSQRQNQLAWQSEAAAKEYNEKMSNMKLVMKIPDTDEALGYKTDDVTYSNLQSMGYLITDAHNKLYLEKDEEGNWIVPKASRLDNEDILDNGIETDENGNPIAHIKGKQFEIADGTQLISEKSTLQNMLMNGQLHVFNTTGSDTFGTSVDQLESNTIIEWVNDTSDDAEAESKYNYETKKLSRLENEIELEIKQLETQSSAIQKEIDSVKELIQKNVDRTFKLFSNG